MEAFNVVAGLVTVASLLLSVWIILDSKKKEAVEREKATTFAHRLADMLSMVNAIAQQATLVASLSDREETTKKELKHLLIAQLTVIKAAQEGLARIHAREEAWRFGVVDRYLPEPPPTVHS